MPEGDGGPGEDADGSVALSLIRDLEGSGKVTREAGELYRSRFRELHEAVRAIRAREAQLLRQASALNDELQSSRATLEEAQTHHDAELQQLRALEAEQQAAQRDVDDAEQESTAGEFRLAELRRDLEELQLQREEVQRENELLVEPELEKLRSEREELLADLRRIERSYEVDMNQKEQLGEMHNRLEETVEAALAEYRDLREAVRKANLEPERVRKQADSVAKAVSNLNEDLSAIQAKMDACDADMERQRVRKANSDEARNHLQSKLELHRDTIEHRQREVDALSRTLDLERSRFHELSTLKVEAELRARGAEESRRHASDELNIAKKELEVSHRKLRKKKSIVEGVREVLPQLEAQVEENRQLLATYKSENKRSRKEHEEMRAEVDVLVARFLQQEAVEGDKRQELESLLAEVDRLEQDLADWQARERKEAKQLSVLAAQRELRSREALRAKAAAKETAEQLRIKELTILDLTKKCTEVNNRLKEYTALYDVVKNERNKYVNLIQGSGQAQAEMREKIRILQNEVNILRAESGAKDRALQKEQALHQAAQTQRDALRLDANKAQSDHRRQQERVEQQIVEIDKLNSIINGLEADMLRLKRQCEDAVEARNLTSTQLADRDVELSVLQEKADLQEETLKRGELALSEKEEEIRLLRLEAAELQRQNEVARKQIPRLPDLSARAEALAKELSVERSITDELCSALEDPGNEARWKALGGSDPDEEQLASKIKALEDQMDSKRKQLLEKDLLIEEVGALVEKLRRKATDGREDATRLALQVNEFQSKIRETTRKMMATVSELSMYQATAMKLEAEKARSVSDLEEARSRMEKGQAPTAGAEREWMRVERDRAAKREAMRARQREASAGSAPLAGQRPAAFLRTTAEARPTAYIPDGVNDPLRQTDGLPKPYNFQPFKPQEPGSTMRFIREPEPPEIEI